MTTDPDFNDRLRANDSFAWSLAYDRLFNKAKQKINSVLFSSADHDVENLTSEVLSEFVKAVIEEKNENINSAKTFDDLVNMIAYIARFRTISYLKRGRRHSLVGMDPDKLEVIAEQIQALDSDSSFEKLTMAEIEDCVSRLPERLKLLLELRMAGLSVREIAAQLEMNYNTACWLLAEAKSKLRDCLKRKGK